MEQILGWIGNGLFFWAVFLLAEKKPSGFVVNVLANILYGLQSILMGNWSLLWCSIGLAIINVYGWYCWIKKPRKQVNLKQKAELDYARSVADLYK